MARKQIIAVSCKPRCGLWKIRASIMNCMLTNRPFAQSNKTWSQFDSFTVMLLNKSSIFPFDKQACQDKLDSQIAKRNS